jgi:hypothetical protein
MGDQLGHPTVAVCALSSIGFFEAVRAFQLLKTLQSSTTCIFVRQDRQPHHRITLCKSLPDETIHCYRQTAPSRPTATKHTLQPQWPRQQSSRCWGPSCTAAVCWGWHRNTAAGMAQKQAVLAARPHAGCQAAQVRQRCREESHCGKLLCVLQQVHQQQRIVLRPLRVWLPPGAVTTGCSLSASA